MLKARASLIGLAESKALFPCEKGHQRFQVFLANTDKFTFQSLKVYLRQINVQNYNFEIEDDITATATIHKHFKSHHGVRHTLHLPTNWAHKKQKKIKEAFRKAGSQCRIPE